MFAEESVCILGLPLGYLFRRGVAYITTSVAVAGVESRFEGKDTQHFIA